MTWALAVTLRPIVLFLLLLLTGCVVVYPIRRFMRDGKLKRLLLTDVSGDANARRLRELWRKQQARKHRVTTRAK